MRDAEALAEYFESDDVVPVFRERASAIEPEYRNAWRVTAVLLALAHGRGGSLTVAHVNVLWWAMKSEGSRKVFLAWSQGMKDPSTFIVRFDPIVSRALDLAVGQGLVEEERTGKFKLTSSGRDLVDLIDQDETVLVSEKRFFASLPKTLSQTWLRKLLEWNIET